MKFESNSTYLFSSDLWCAILKLNCIPDMILQSRLNGELDENLKKVANQGGVFYYVLIDKSLFCDTHVMLLKD